MYSHTSSLPSPPSPADAGCTAVAAVDPDDRRACNMGAAVLVLTPAAERHRTIVAVEDPAGRRHPVAVDVEDRIADEMMLAAAGQHFDDLAAAGRWVFAAAMGLVAGHAPSARPWPGELPVRIAVARDEAGNWSAVGGSDRTDEQAKATAAADIGHGCAVCFVEVELPPVGAPTVSGIVA